MRGFTQAGGAMLSSLAPTASTGQRISRRSTRRPAILTPANARSTRSRAGLVCPRRANSSASSSRSSHRSRAALLSNAFSVAIDGLPNRLRNSAAASRSLSRVPSSVYHQATATRGSHAPSSDRPRFSASRSKTALSTATPASLASSSTRPTCADSVGVPQLSALQ